MDGPLHDVQQGGSADDFRLLCVPSHAGVYGAHEDGILGVARQAGGRRTGLETKVGRPHEGPP